MGGVCSSGVSKKTSFKSDLDLEQRKTSGFSGNLRKGRSSGGKQQKQNKIDDSSNAYPDFESYEKSSGNLYDSGELKISISRELKPSTPARTSTPAKGPHVSFLGKAGLAGFEKAVDVLDTLGSSMSNLNNSGFIGGMEKRGNKIDILAFEVANTIAKGANLLQSLSEENILYLKKEILPSEGVQLLVSTDMKELLSIAAADKREEFDVFSREVIRFGDLCKKDPQWHNLGRFFSKLDSDPTSSNLPREEAELTMQELTTLAQYTSELYHELHALDRFEQDYRRKLEEVDSLNLPRKGESLMMLQSELKHQRKLVRGLKKKSLWSKSLEEVVEKLVDAVTFIHQEISEAFGDNGSVSSTKEHQKVERLGVAGLALHYANLVTQIDNIASRPTSLPPNMRDTLYNGLPPAIKIALRSRMQLLSDKDQPSIPQIKAEMEKTLQWLVPVAADTSKAHQGFGWVGEWANTGNEFGRKTTAGSSIIRLQTLYHADKKRMDSHILELVTWLHRLISLVRYRDNGAHVPTRSPLPRGPNSNSSRKAAHGPHISLEDRNLLDEVTRRRKMAIVRSKSQEFLVTKKAKSKVWALSRSTGSSPRVELGYPKASVLDILDGLDIQHRFFE